MSKGEERIVLLLRRAGIKFEREKTFGDLRAGKFRYDFYLKDYNILLEYDGEQHFKMVPHFHKNRQGFMRAQENDRRKNSYALANNIPLYRIPYWELEKIGSGAQLISEQYRVKNRFHNDYLLTNANLL